MNSLKRSPLSAAGFNLVSLPLVFRAGLALAAAAAVWPGRALRAASIEEYIAQAPFPMPSVPVPVFANRTFAITDYGAVGDGQTLNTAAFAKAIDACAAAGGGHVVVPPGLWLTGPIALKSRVDLHAERGALVQFTSDHAAYPMATREGRGFVTTSPITGVGLKNIGLTGEGVYDGAGETWRPVKKEKTTEAQWKAFLAKGGATSGEGSIWWPTKEAMDGEDTIAELARKTEHPTAEQVLPTRDFRRPHLVYLADCENVLLEGVTLRNSPMYVFCPNRCVNLTVRFVTIFNEWWAQNGDGMDIGSCENVVIYRCNVNAGDDGICMKSSAPNPLGGKAGLENVIVAECTVYHAHGGFVIGSNTDAGMHNLWATHCDYVGTDVGIRVKSGLGRGGLVHDVFIDHIFMKDIANQAILFDTFYENAPASAATDRAKPVKNASKVPEFTGFHISELYCHGAGEAIAITGLPQQAVHGITIDNAVIEAKKGMHATDAADITLTHVRILTPETPVVTQKRTTGIRFID